MKDDNSNTLMGCIVMGIIVTIIIFLINLAFYCSGKGRGIRLDDGGRWEPRHTQVIKPSQNNVNKLVFHTKLLQG